MSPSFSPTERTRRRLQFSLVGRDREQSMLHIALEEMLTGHGALVLISGEAGIGKTTLVDWLADEAEDQGCLVLKGGCYDLSVTPPYGPWIELVRRYRPGDDLPQPPAFFRDDQALAAVHGESALFDDSARFLAAVAVLRPIVIVLEDLHWADRASIDLLRYLARQVSEHRVLLLATHRPDELHSRDPLNVALPLIVREAGAQRIDVRPFGSEGNRELIRSRYALSDWDERRLETYLGARSEGNPLFATELLQTLEESSLLRPAGDTWQLGQLTEVSVPTLLRQVIEGRLSRLGGDANAHLVEASLIGQDVPLALWSAVAQVPESELLEEAKGAINARLFDPTDDGFRFVHALIREAIYETVLPVSRRERHQQIAEVLLQHPDPDPDEVAYHLKEADDERAVEWLIKAGERAERAYAWLTAADRFEDAVSLMKVEGGDYERRVVLLNLIARLRRYVDPRRSLSALEEALRVASASNDSALEACTLFEVGIHQWYVGDAPAGFKLMEAGVDALDKLSSLERMRLDTLGFEIDKDNQHGTLAAILSGVGRFADAMAHGLRAISELSVSAAPHYLGGSSYGDACLGLMESYANLGQPEDSLNAFEKTREAYRVAEHHVQVCWTAARALQQVVLPYFSDDQSLRHRLARDSEEAGILASSTLAGLPPRHGLVLLLTTEGRWDEAFELARSLRVHARPSVYREFAAAAVGVMARAHGDLERAWTVVRELVPGGSEAKPGDSPFLESVAAQRLAVSLSMDALDFDRARDWLEAHDRWLDWSGSVQGRAESALLWAQYHYKMGDARKARQEADTALALALDPRQPLAQIAIYRFIGALDRVSKQLDDAEAHLSESLKLAGACAAPLEQALTLLELAELRADQGRADDAFALLADARVICDPLGAKPTLERIEELQGRLNPPKNAPGFSAGLSPREVEVLCLVADGLTDAEIADRLFVSRRTVTSHITNIFNKLGVNARAAAVAVAARTKIIS